MTPPTKEQIASNIALVSNNIAQNLANSNINTLINMLAEKEVECQSWKAKYEATLPPPPAPEAPKVS